MNEPVLIESLDDPRVAGFRDVRDRDLRGGGHDGRFVVESARCIGRLLRSSFEIESLFCSPRRLAELAGALLPASPFPIHVADEPLIATIAGYHVHGGALALAKRPSSRTLSFPAWAGRIGAMDGVATTAGARSTRTIIALSGVTHMDNVGSIFRSAAGLSIDGILLDERCCDPLLRKPIRVAMGHSLTVPFAWSSDLVADLEQLRGAGGWRIAALEEGVGARTPSPLTSLPSADRMVLVAGNEGHGLDRAIIERCDDLIEIPMAEGVPSLNVAVAVALACWERRRGGAAGRADEGR